MVREIFCVCSMPILNHNDWILSCGLYSDYSLGLSSCNLPVVLFVTLVMEKYGVYANNINMKTYKIRMNFLLVAVAVFFVCSCQSFAVGQDGEPESVRMRAMLVDEAKHYLGKPYRYGARGPDAFDCSGFVRYVASSASGITLPRTSQMIYNYSDAVPDEQREIGDLVFFKVAGENEISHVGIYIGDNSFIHAASAGRKTGVIISSLSEGYWKRNYYATGKILPSADSRSPAELRVVASQSPAESQPQAESESLPAMESPAESRTETFVKRVNKILPISNLF